MQKATIKSTPTTIQAMMSKLKIPSINKGKAVKRIIRIKQKKMRHKMTNLTKMAPTRLTNKPKAVQI